MNFLKNSLFRDLKTGKYIKDNSPIYSLPFEVGRKVWLVQAYDSKLFSHQEELALDFKIKEGTIICAARGGIVDAMYSESDKGGLKPSNYSDGNYVIIKHDDGSYAGYWHLQKNSVLVQVGERVTAGTLLGRSGNTGYSAFPHLHFYVWREDGEMGYRTIPTRFYTHRGIRYLRPGRFYKRKRH